MCSMWLPFQTHISICISMVEVTVTFSPFIVEMHSLGPYVTIDVDSIIPGLL